MAGGLLEQMLSATFGQLGQKDHVMVGTCIFSAFFHMLTLDGRLNILGGGRPAQIVLGLCAVFLVVMFTGSNRDNLAHTSQHVVAVSCGFLYAAFSIAEQHALVQDGTSSIVLCVVCLILGALMWDHVGPREVENHGHRMIALSLLAGAAVAARMVIYPFTSWTYRVFCFLMCEIGIILVAVGVWRGDYGRGDTMFTWRSGKDHNDLMILDAWVACATLLLLVATILRWSRRTRNPHGSYDHVETSDAQEISTLIPGREVCDAVNQRPDVIGLPDPLEELPLIA